MTQTDLALAPRNYGEVFTRRWVVEALLDLTGYLPDRDLGAMHLLEPSCGSGAFLGPAVERLIESAHAHGRDLASLTDAIRAYDLQTSHVHIARGLCPTRPGISCCSSASCASASTMLRA